MKSRLTLCVWRVLTGFVLTAVVALSLAASTANAQRPAKRVGPEVAVGGVTAAERVAEKNALRAELAAKMPAGTLDTPIPVELTAEERATLAVQPIVNGLAPLRIGMTKSVSPAIEKLEGAAFRPDMPGKFGITIFFKPKGPAIIRCIGRIKSR